jgi:hypothetical protein
MRSLLATKECYEDTNPANCLLLGLTGTTPTRFTCRHTHFMGPVRSFDPFLA